MKTQTIAASAILALFIIASVSVATAHSGLLAPKASQGVMDGNNGDGGDNNQTTTMQQTSTIQHATSTPAQEDGDGEDNQDQAAGAQLSVGQSFTLSNLTGHFVVSGNDSVEGTATGSLTVMVTGILHDGMTLSITSGHFMLGNTTFTISSGTIVVDSGDGSAVGSGTAGSARFIIQVDGLNGTMLSGADTVHIDLKSGTTEFLISLGTQGSSGDSGDSSGDSSGD